MATKEKFYGVMKTQAAFQKRNAQLQVWEKSDTNKEPDHIAPKRLRPRVKFGDSVIFLAAVQSGDYEEVERLIQEEGADVSSVNKDGLTALHQVRERLARVCTVRCVCVCTCILQTPVWGQMDKYTVGPSYTRNTVTIQPF